METRHSSYGICLIYIYLLLVRTSLKLSVDGICVPFLTLSGIYICRIYININIYSANCNIYILQSENNIIIYNAYLQTMESIQYYNLYTYMTFDVMHARGK